MPWLFVDYDPGAGGERLCSILSQSPQCKTLKFKKYKSGRTKVLDDFGNEWLKLKYVKPYYLESDPILYNVVPVHRITNLAEKTLGKVNSIRIANPTSEEYWQRLKNDEINKILLTVETDKNFFYGLIKVLLAEDCADPEKLKKCKLGTPTIDLYLITRGYEVNQKNRDIFLEIIKNQRYPEPDYKYDYIVSYEDYINNFDKVKQNIYKIFGISIND